ncbi:MAG: hypothetical protein ACKVZ0_20675 [Gemmatimonadales bacterium]
MRLFSLITLTAVLAACAPAGKAGDEEKAAATPTVADFAGTWNGEAMLDGTPNPVKSVVTLGADGSGTITLEGRSAIPATVIMSGDSLVIESAEYESVLRPGVMVTTRVAQVRVDGMLKGNMVANYKMPDGLTVVKGTWSSTKAP